ncbi:sensor histidine kinase [Sphingobacterium sp. SYP-B4668]|uniref:sensor histidine kinase n=1 Tax=Sphingobacterium sp. SYP-B4668 TaxID=2996035 RepID=UPI0005323E90|nr:HAMP domain-containing sensor histidine kinase [Sphingobacterium sp. SYP-B4668]
MKQKSITVIIGLMSIALLGVMAMQYFFIRDSFRQKSQLFDEAVNASLSTVASKVEKHEVMAFAKTQQKSNQEKYEREQKRLEEQINIQKQIESLRVRQYETQQKFKDAEDHLKMSYPIVVSIENSFYETYIRRTRYNYLVKLKISQGINYEDNAVDNSIEVYAVEKIAQVDGKDDSSRYLAYYNLYDLNAIGFTIKTLPPRADMKLALRIHELERKLKLTQLNDAANLYDSIAVMGGKKTDVIEDFAASIELSKKPLKERINLPFLEREISKELLNRDITSEFNIEVRENNNLIYNINTLGELDKPQKHNSYSTLLFQGDLGNAPGKLTISFPNKKNIIMDNMGYLFFPMGALLVLLIGCFAYTLTTIYRQKKISEMKTDFINNMTHEFKTPVATIMIASESLRDPEIITDQKRVNRLANIIYDENIRLGDHIERVLNIARLEKENLKIDRIDVRINELTNAVLDSMNLQLQKSKGTLEVYLEAKEDTVIGDELHLSNVLFNLVDNAIKYSRHAPHIVVKTHNHKNTIVISVADNGIGMTREQQQKIFDQFYRIPTGNIHNVKGFGLGLSYVNDIIKRLDGRIQVKSEKDKGTHFDVTLPLKGYKL